MTLQLPILLRPLWEIEALSLPHKKYQGLLAYHKAIGAISIFMYFFYWRKLFQKMFYQGCSVSRDMGSHHLTVCSWPIADWSSRRSKSWSVLIVWSRHNNGAIFYRSL